ncbi:MAG: hypothetical protein ACYDAC_06385 [Candidatus Dormibacteria bacterium]
MIDPDVRIIDLEPDGFALICRIASAAQRSTPTTISVLHDSGVPVVAHHSDGEEVPPACLDRFDDPPRRARTLQAEHGVDRVVMYDRSRADDLAAHMVGNSGPHVTQLEAFWANSDSFWSSPAIAVAPPPPPNPWRVLPARLRRAGDDWWGVLALYEGDTCAASLLGHVGGGRVDILTSLDHLGTGVERPVAAEAGRLLDLAAPLGRVALGLACEAALFAEALSAPDPLAALADLEHDPRAHLTHNLHILRS